MTIDRNSRPCACGNKAVWAVCLFLELVKAVYGDQAGRSGCNFEDVERRIREGDQFCMDCYQRACESLGIGIINIVNVINRTSSSSVTIWRGRIRNEWKP